MPMSLPETPMPQSSPSPATPSNPRPGAVAAPPPVAPPMALRQWSSAVLLGGAGEVEIVHGTSVYRLRHTSLGKLILTK